MVIERYREKMIHGYRKVMDNFRDPWCYELDVIISLFHDVFKIKISSRHCYSLILTD
jgi:hypothetical protein